LFGTLRLCLNLEQLCRMDEALTNSQQPPPYDAIAECGESLPPPGDLKPSMVFRGDECTVAGRNAPNAEQCNAWWCCAIGPFALCLCRYTQKFEFRHDTREVIMRRFYMCKETAHSMPYDNLPTAGPTLYPLNTAGRQFKELMEVDPIFTVGLPTWHRVQLDAKVTGSACCCDPTCGSWPLTRFLPDSRPFDERDKWRQYFRRIKAL
jgi:hypothetical protein